MIIPFENQYSGTRLTRAGAVSEMVTIAGAIKSITIIALNVGSLGDFVFNVEKNGVPLFSATPSDNRIIINSANKIVSKTGLDIATVLGDKLTLKLESVGAGGLLSPVYCLVSFDDGESAETDIAADIHAQAAKTIPVNADEFALVDSAASNALKKLTWQNLKAALKTYFDTLYQAPLVSGTSLKTINSQSLLGSGNIDISGGGSGGDVSVDNFYSIDAKPNSDIHPLSDYFDVEADTLANSTAFQGSHHRLVIDGGRAKLILPSAATEISTGRFWELPSGDCTIIAKVWNYAEKVNYANVGIALFQYATNNPNICDYISRRAEKLATDYRLAVAHYSSYTTPSAYIGGQPPLGDAQNQTPIYLKFSRTGGTWTAYYSQNGKLFTSITTVSEGSYFIPKEFGIIAVNNTHGNTNTFDVEFIYFYDSAKAVLPGGGIKQIESAVTEQTINIGDSLTRSFGTYEMDSYPNKLADSLDAVAVGYDGNVFRADDGIRTKKVINRGYDGYTTQNIIDNILPNVILRYDAALTRNIAVVFAGTNDIANGDSAATVYGRLTTICTTLLTVGYEVYICTLIDRNDLGGGFDTVRTALNSMITGTAAGATGVIDLFADSRLADASNSTYFQSDALHLKAAGNSAVAENVQDVIYP